MAGRRAPVPRRLVVFSGACCPYRPAGERKVPVCLRPKFILRASNYLVASEKHHALPCEDRVASSGKSRVGPRPQMNSTKQMLAVQSVVQELLAELHPKSGCDKLCMTRESLAEILCEVGVKSTTPAASQTELRTFFLNLRGEELALARACAA